MHSRAQEPGAQPQRQGGVRRSDVMEEATLDPGEDVDRPEGGRTLH